MCLRNSLSFVLLVALAGTPALADFAPQREDREHEIGRAVSPAADSYSLLVPSLEIAGPYGPFVAVNRAVDGREWTHVSLESVRENLRADWVVDGDDFTVNEIGHPYQGSPYFTAAR